MNTELRARTTAPLPITTPGATNYVGGDPGLGLDHDLFGVDVDSGAGVVMRARTNIGALRDDGAITDLDLANGVENHLVADVAMIADLKLPGIRDAHRRPKECALADVGAE